jgi:hypothetical protein
MTSLALHPPASREPDAPIPWRRLAWVTWRQHRAAFAAAAAVLVAMCLLMLAEGLTARANHLGRVACHVAGGCYSPSYAGAASTTALAIEILPAFIGVFLGAPLLARELETGTFRFAWTQECGRRRWLVAKLVPLAIVVTAATAAASIVTWWYLQPFISAGLISGIRSPEFNVRGVDFAAWTLVAFAIGVLMGGLVRRVLPAIFVALCAWVGLFFVTLGVLRPHYAAPYVGTASAITVKWWIIGQSHAGADVLYQPESRFWLLQSVEGSWLLLLAVILLAGTVWYVRRRMR